jgi:hypothetical protein
VDVGGRWGYAYLVVNSAPLFTPSFAAVSRSPQASILSICPKTAFESLMGSLLSLEGGVSKESRKTSLAGEGHVSVREHSEKKKT